MKLSPHQRWLAVVCSLALALDMGRLPQRSCCHASELIRPRALSPGDTVMFVAPAGPLDREKMELAGRRLREMGFQVRIPESLYRRAGYLAGSDEQRASELMQAFADSDVDAVFPGTGGYGTLRILPQLDFELIRSHPKVLVGFSDITALHVAIYQKTGLVTFHSPNPMWGLGNEDNLTEFSAGWFWRALLREHYGEGAGKAAPGYVISALVPVPSDQARQGKALEWEPTPASSRYGCGLSSPRALRPGRASGRLIGGNLSLIAATLGTAYEIDTKGKILFLEDVGEAPYRIDRMLCTMKLAGKMDDLAGVVLGMFTRRKDEDTSEEVTTIDDVLSDYFLPLGVPVLHGFPIGHHRCNATIPVGVLCQLDADAGTLRLLEDPVQTDAR